jgi:hypothetical protein
MKTMKTINEGVSMTFFEDKKSIRLLIDGDSFTITKEMDLSYYKELLVKRLSPLEEDDSISMKLSIDTLEKFYGELI